MRLSRLNAPAKTQQKLQLIFYTLSFWIAHQILVPMVLKLMCEKTSPFNRFAKICGKLKRFTVFENFPKRSHVVEYSKID